MWVVNAVGKKWEDQLPKDVQDALNGSRKKKGGLYAKEESAKDADAEDKEAKGESAHGMCSSTNLCLQG